jgi:hypothetical protein
MRRVAPQAAAGKSEAGRLTGTLAGPCPTVGEHGANRNSR